MIPVLVTVGVSLLAGITTAFIAHRHRRADLGGPHLAGERIEHVVHAHPRATEAMSHHATPQTATGVGLGIASIALIVVAAGVGTIYAMVRVGIGFERSDEAVARWAAEYATPTGSDVLRLISDLGGTTGVVVVGLGAVLSQLTRLSSRSERVTLLAFVTLTIGGQFAISNVVKLAVGRARPDLDQLTGHSGSSFPSGHATAAAATFAVAALVIGRGRSLATATALWSVAVAIAVGVACTRVMLGVHWTTDVIAGLLTGWGWFALCSVAFGGRLLRFGAPAEVAQLVLRHDRGASEQRGDRGDGPGPPIDRSR